MKQQFLKYVANLRFAILNLLLIALFSILGTIIEQDQSIETYKVNYPLIHPVFGLISWKTILYFGLDHVYRTWWFISLILIFGTSLFTCTVLQQLPALKIARRCQFFRTSLQFKRLDVSTTIKNKSLNALLFNIKHQKYLIFQQKNIFYCYKGLIGKIAPIIVHFSMILILIGSIVSSLTAFKSQEIVPKTELFHIQNIVSNGPFAKIYRIPNRVNDFWVTYSKTNTVEQFYSDLSILNENGDEIFQKTIYVNSPAKYNGLTYYQSDWNLIGLRLKNNNLNITQYPLISLLKNKEKIWVSWIPSNKEQSSGLTVLTNNLQGYFSLYDKSGKFLENIELNDANFLNKEFIFVDLISSTGLQVKVDPGIPLIYIGFGFLMISTLLSYITYSQIWIIQNQNNLFIGGSTTRALFEFESEFFQLIK